MRTALDRSTDRDRSKSRDIRRRSAARWFIALRERAPTARSLRLWERWNAAADNRHEFDELVHLWRRLEEGSRPLSPSPAELATDDYDGAVSVAEWRAMPRVRRSRRRRFGVAAGAVGLAASLAALVLGGMTLLSTYLQPLRSFAPMVVYETSRAEHRRIVLSDGTRVHLGARSSLTASITPYARTVVLDRGEALFQVAKDADRPFRVLAGRGTITAVGTAFNVRRHDEGLVIVTVTEGTVEVAPELRPPDRPVASDAPRASDGVRRVDRGHQISYDAAGQFGLVLVADAERSLSWREGRLSYSSEPLHRVITDVNRYSRRFIVIGDRTAGELLYSGTLFEAEVEEWIAGLERIYPTLEVTSTDAQHVLVRTREANTSADLDDRADALSVPAD